MDGRDPPTYTPPPTFTGEFTGEQLVDSDQFAMEAGQARYEDGLRAPAIQRVQSAHWADLVAMLPSQQPEAYAAADAAIYSSKTISPRALTDIMRGASSANLVGTPSRHGPTSRKATAIRTMARHRTLARARTLARSRSTAGPLLPKRSTTVWNLVAGEAGEQIQESKYVISQIKEQPTHINTKIEMMREEKMILRETKANVSMIGVWWLDFRRTLHYRYEALCDFARTSKLWYSSIKVLEGKHGAAVGTYFVFLRWCFFLNVFLAIMWGLTIMLPYTLEHGRASNKLNLFNPPVDNDYSFGEDFLGLFTGGGALNHTVYFMGSYMFNFEGRGLEPVPSTHYDVPLAYIMTMFAFFFVCFWVVFLSVRTAAYNFVATEEQGAHVLSEIVFGAYDHSLTNAKSIGIKQAGISLLLREILHEAESKKKYEALDKKRIYLKRAAINGLIFFILAMALWGVQASVVAFSDDNNKFISLIPAILLSILNVMLPVGFEILAKFEEWRTPLFVIQVSVIRASVLRIVGLYVFFYTNFLNRTKFMCWETYVGQQVYNLVVVLFFFEMVTSVVVDPLKKFMFARFQWTHMFISDARFQTIKNTLETIYTQAIIWFGAFFCPILPLIGAAKCFLLFYLKRWSTLKFCKPPQQAFKATYSLQGLIYAVLLVTLLCVAVPLGYTIVSLPCSGALMPLDTQDRWINNDTLPFTGTGCVSSATCADCLDNDRIDATAVCWVSSPAGDFPSGAITTLGDLCATCVSGCGPFRHQESMIITLSSEVDTWPPVAQTVFRYLFSFSFAVITIVILLSWLLISGAKQNALREQTHKLKVERDLERMDKIWILEKYSITLDMAALPQPTGSS